MTSPDFPAHGEGVTGIGARLGRRDLTRRTLEVLQRGSWANPDVSLVSLDAGRRVVVKDFAPRSRWLRTLFGRWLIAREARAYRVLAGHPAIPTFLGCLDPLALVLEYRPGTPMSRSLAGQLPEGFLDELRAAVREMHGRGIVHLDLRHRSNLLADPAGHPVMIDFASAVFLRPGSLLSRFLFGLLARIDWGAVRKWEDRVSSPDLAPDAESRSDTNLGPAL